MRRSERLTAIIDRVNESRNVDAFGLATALGVSTATIRRDLQALSDGGLLVRTHGGAVANELGTELPTQVKAAVRQAEKRGIGQAAAALVPDDVVVGMTGGTTTLQIARALANRPRVAVVTNAINIAAELVGRRGLLVVIGGVVRQSAELVGPAAEAMLANYHFDTTFIGVDGLTAEEGCTTYDEMEAQTDLAFLHRSRRRVVVADSSKIGLVRFARITGLSEITDVVTDRGADAAQLEAFRRAGVNVLTV